MKKPLSALLGAAALIGTATASAAREIPREFHGEWCLVELVDDGDMQVYRRAVNHCRPDRLMVLNIKDFAIVKSTGKGNPSTLCAAPSFEPRGEGGVITADCGASDDNSPVEKVAYRDSHRGWWFVMHYDGAETHYGWVPQSILTDCRRREGTP